VSITFETDNNVIVYALEKILTYARDNRYIFLVQSIWWIALIIGLQKELIIHIDNLRLRWEIHGAAGMVYPDSANIHPA